MSEAIKIDEEGRYVLIIQPKTQGGMDKLDISNIAKSIRDWWESGQKFFFLVGIADLEIRLERMEGEHNVIEQEAKSSTT